MSPVQRCSRCCSRCCHVTWSWPNEPTTQHIVRYIIGGTAPLWPQRRSSEASLQTPSALWSVALKRTRRRRVDGAAAALTIAQREARRASAHHRRRPGRAARSSGPCEREMAAPTVRLRPEPDGGWRMMNGMRTRCSSHPAPSNVQDSSPQPGQAAPALAAATRTPRRTNRAKIDFRSASLDDFIPRPSRHARPVASTRRRCHARQWPLRANGRPWPAARGRGAPTSIRRPSGRGGCYRDTGRPRQAAMIMTARCGRVDAWCCSGTTADTAAGGSCKAWAWTHPRDGTSTCRPCLREEADADQARPEL